MVSNITMLTILGAGVGIFLISFGLYGLYVENAQKMLQADYNKILLDAENLVSETMFEVEKWQKKCNEDIPKENKQEISECLKILKQKRIELTGAHAHLNEIKIMLGLH